MKNREEDVAESRRKCPHEEAKEHNMHRTPPTILQEDLESEDPRAKGDNGESQMTSNCHPSTVKKIGRCG